MSWLNDTPQYRSTSTTKQHYSRTSIQFSQYLFIKDMKANDIKLYKYIKCTLFTRFLTFRWATSYPKLRSESSSDNSRDYTHSFWVASEQLTINPTLSQMTGFAHPSFTCNAETHEKLILYLMTEHSERK